MGLGTEANQAVFTGHCDRCGTESRVVSVAENRLMCRACIEEEAVTLGRELYEISGYVLALQSTLRQFDRNGR